MGSFFYKLKYICLNTKVCGTYHKVFPLKFDLSLLSSLLFNFILQTIAHSTTPEKEMRSEKSERRQNGHFGEDTYFIPGKH